MVARDECSDTSRTTRPKEREAYMEPIPEHFGAPEDIEFSRHPEFLDKDKPAG